MEMSRVGKCIETESRLVVVREEGERMGDDYLWIWVSFVDDENILALDSGDGYITLWIYQNPLNCTFFCIFGDTPAVYGGCQARGPIRAVATSLHHSHSNARSKLRL